MWQQLLGTMLGGSGMSGGAGQFGGSQGKEGLQFGQEAMQQGPKMLDQAMQSAEFGTQGMPPSLQSALRQNNQQIDQMVQNTPQANFDQFQTGVLPELGQIPAPQAQSFPVSQQGQAPSAMPYSSLAGGIGQQQLASARPSAEQLAAGPPPAQQGFNPFNMTGSVDQSPGSTQPIDPNMFLRLSEGYNRGGLLGALGSFLTDYTPNN